MRAAALGNTHAHGHGVEAQARRRDPAAGESTEPRGEDGSAHSWP